MLEGTMGIYEYASYIRSIVEGRTIVYQCDEGTRVQGEWRQFLTNSVQLLAFCAHPKRTMGDLEDGKIKLESMLGAYEYADYIEFIGHSRSIVFECTKGYNLQGSLARRPPSGFQTLAALSH